MERESENKNKREINSQRLEVRHTERHTERDTERHTEIDRQNEIEIESGLSLADRSG